MDNDSNHPSETAVAAAYQVTARWFASEQQLIWRRTAFFVTLNSLVVAAAQFLPPMHPTIRVLIPTIGVIYSICWHFSMNRTWAYQTFLTRMLREQEAVLNLSSLGAFTRATCVMHGGRGESVAGELTRIPAHHTVFKAKLMSDATTWLFLGVYAAFFLYGVSQLCAA